MHNLDSTEIKVTDLNPIAPVIHPFRLKEQLEDSQSTDPSAYNGLVSTLSRISDMTG